MEGTEGSRPIRRMSAEEEGGEGKEGKTESERPQLRGCRGGLSDRN